VRGELRDRDTQRCHADAGTPEEVLRTLVETELAVTVVREYCDGPQSLACQCEFQNAADR
jgi:hypothetical protein